MISSRATAFSDFLKKQLRNKKVREYYNSYYIEDFSESHDPKIKKQIARSHKEYKVGKIRPVSLLLKENELSNTECLIIQNSLSILYFSSKLSLALLFSTKFRYLLPSLN